MPERTVTNQQVDQDRSEVEGSSLADALGMDEDIEFEPPRMDIAFRPVDLSCGSGRRAGSTPT